MNKLISIHANVIPLPLLGNFPKNRIDINPYVYKDYHEGVWGQYLLQDLCRLNDRDPIFLFLDTHTIANLNLLDIDVYKGDIYLFIGDTQHGPEEGFIKLVQLTKLKCIKRIYFINNPHHAHWFAESDVDFERFYFLPLGLANFEIDSCWTGNCVEDKVVHVGNAESTHKYRNHLLELSKLNYLNLALLKTKSYSEANYIHSKARASINISLNGDLSFRLSEILISGGLCLSDDLGFIQKLNFDYFDSNQLITFSNSVEFIHILQSLQSFSSHKKINDEQRLHLMLRDQNDMVRLQKKIIEPRRDYWQKSGGSSLHLLKQYLRIRNLCQELAYPLVECKITNEDELDFFLYLIDLPKLHVHVAVSEFYQLKVLKIIDIFKLKDRFYLSEIIL